MSKTSTIDQANKCNCRFLKLFARTFSRMFGKVNKSGLPISSLMNFFSKPGGSEFVFNNWLAISVKLGSLCRRRLDLLLIFLLKRESEDWHVSSETFFSAYIASRFIVFYRLRFQFIYQYWERILTVSCYSFAWQRFPENITWFCYTWF